MTQGSRTFLFAFESYEITLKAERWGDGEMQNSYIWSLLSFVLHKSSIMKYSSCKEQLPIYQKINDTQSDSTFCNK